MDGNADMSELQGVMVNADGEFVIAHSDEKTWKQYQEKQKQAAAAQEAVASNKELQDRGIECPIDKRMFVDPMKTPCCGRTYCGDCITNALIENDLVCPGCSTDGVLIDDLVEDTEATDKVKAYETEKAQEKKEKEASMSPVTSAATPVKAPADSRSPQSERDRSKSPSVPAANGTTTTSKKRPASDANDEKPAPDDAPVMKRQKSTDSSKADAVKSPTSSKPAIPQMSLNSFMPPDMSQMSQANGFPQMPFPMPNMPFPMSMPPMMPGNMNMNMGMMNPMMMAQMMGGGNFNPMAAMNGMPQMPMNNNFNPNNNWNNNNNNNPNMGRQQHQQSPYPNQQQQQQHPQYPQNSGYNNQQPHGTFPNNKFANQQRSTNDDDNAYFRQPVSPQRAQNRQKRVRPSDYREL